MPVISLKKDKGLMIDFSKKITPARMYRTTANLQMALESDREKIINSAAIRRLQQKTQVFPLERNAAVRLPPYSLVRSTTSRALYRYNVF